MSLHIIRPGLLATVQDLGRFHYQKYGVTVGGALDTSAARIANMLVGNSESEAVLELTLAGAELYAARTMVVAMCGGDMAALINGRPFPLWRPVIVLEGSVMKLQQCRSGSRTYIAIAGGFDIPPVMGSRSTYIRAGIGGYEGRALKAGDILPIQPLGQYGYPARFGSVLDGLMKRFIAEATGGGISSAHKKMPIGWQLADSCAAPNWHAGHFAIVASNHTLMEPIVRITAGAHYERFTLESREALARESFELGLQSDRMGCRLEGPALRLTAPLELITEGVANGTIQVPPDGKPIVLLADRQTTGGYPRIAHVAAVDLPVLAQLKPGDRFRFQVITQHEAERLVIAVEREMRQLQAAIALKFAEALRE